LMEKKLVQEYDLCVNMWIHTFWEGPGGGSMS
jgi:hypothetical protein